MRVDLVPTKTYAYDSKYILLILIIIETARKNRNILTDGHSNNYLRFVDILHITVITAKVYIFLILNVLLFFHLLLFF